MSLRWIRKLSSLKNDIRGLLRETAQPVAVVTSHMPREHTHDPRSKFHGATLSSFSSIALDPHPLVAFSLRIPSRMASSLQALDPDLQSHMVINILSAAQAFTAVQFARPDLHPHPFNICPYSLSEDGLPVLDNSLGAMSCKLIASPLPLHDLDAFGRRWLDSGEGVEKEEVPWAGPGVTSELFIARVIRVENVSSSETEDPLRTLPLLYHRQSYTTASPIPPSIQR